SHFPLASGDHRDPTYRLALLIGDRPVDNRRLRRSGLPAQDERGGDGNGYEARSDNSHASLEFENQFQTPRRKCRPACPRASVDVDEDVLARPGRARLPPSIGDHDEDPERDKVAAAPSSSVLRVPRSGSIMTGRIRDPYR